MRPNIISILGKSSTLYPNAAGWGPIPPQTAQGTPAQINTEFSITSYPIASNWIPLQSKTTNITPGSLLQSATGTAIGSLGSLGGIPQVTQIGQSITDSSKNYSIKSSYAVAAETQMKPIPGVQYADFRARKFVFKGADTNIGGTTIRLDGASAALRTKGGGTAAKYAVAAANPLGGAYSVFNLDSWYGWGDHDNPYAIRNDFTARSNIATQWDTVDGWTPTRNPLEVVTPFRGDKVTVIDFGKRTLSEAYLWRPRFNFKNGKEVTQSDKDSERKENLEKFLNKLNITRDFIKFFITGPTLHAGLKDTVDKDNIMVFRAAITSLGDTFTAGWTDVQMIGRADPNYQYTGYSRDLSLDFTVYATDRDEIKPIWRKLNALAGYTAPKYDTTNIGMTAPWIRITIGDIFYQQAALISSLQYTYYDAETPWEINIENDPEMMQVPMRIDVSMTLKLVTDSLPQQEGRFFSLAKEFETDATPKQGSNNWLSDFDYPGPGKETTIP